MKVRLVINQGPHKGKEISVSSSSTFTVGRSSECQLRPASQAISKKHCTLEVRDDKCFVTDLDSTNGTYINDERIQGERELHNGQILKIGPLEFQVKFIQPTAPAAPPVEAPAEAEETVEAPPPAAKPKKKVAARAAEENVDEEDVAAMLLDLDAKPAQTEPEAAVTEEEEIPGGSTIMDILMPKKDGPSVSEPYRPQSANKQQASQANTSNAAKEILEMYRRRPRT